LRSIGVTQDILVPICVERSLAMIVGILGILKAGGAYVPIDTDLPEERIRYMLEDTSATIVVTSKESRSKIQATAGVELIELDAINYHLPSINDQLFPQGGINRQPSTVNGQLSSTNYHQPTTRPHHLAYVIYTSGSTGKPKGVMIEHKSLVDYVFGLKQKIQIDKCCSFALVSNIATDLGNTVLYSSLIFGGALHLFSKEAINDSDILHRYFREHAIDCVKIVPSHWKALSIHEKLLPVKLLIFGGEALQAEVAENIKLSGANCRIINHYGPTETTIGKLLHVVEPDVKYNATIPIGKPFSNTKVYILSKELELCPVGVPGELYIAGDGLARGYANNSDLTENKFIQNPFNKRSKSLLYRTGDLVKYLQDGNIEFIGRIDEQVKIRGYRIEPGEIESVLQQSALVSGAVVIAREDNNGNKRLVGYIVANGFFDQAGIVSYLKNEIPEYMIPAQWVELQAFPLMAHGKINKKALPDLDDLEGSSDQYIAPRNDLEKRLALIWQKLLEVEQVSIHDNFFKLGGHSLLAIQLI
ncbi:MAG: amino acid adenylation domain-containing protein, partial [Chitinophagaceae bacterium]